MRKMAFLPVLILPIAAASIQAQDSPSFDGVWRLRMLKPQAPRTRDGEMVLNGASGTFKIFALKNLETINNPCIGTAFPLKVEPSEGDAALTVRVRESEKLPGCPDFKLSLHWVTAQRLEGTTHDGTLMTIERN